MSIDSLYEGVIKKLTAQGRIKTISQEILRLENIADKVLYVYELIDELDAFPKILQVDKCETISTHYRNLGNKKYQQSDYYKAWQYYNLSLLYAPLDSESHSLALSNRSAIFVALQKFTESLNDIEKVFSMKYPDKLKEKLDKRKELCTEKLLENVSITNSESNIEFTLQDPQHPRFPCASSKLEVVYSKEMGRHVIAKTDINVGELLIQEDPYFTLLLKSQYLFSCSYCLSRSLNLLPCHSCCFALYCSNECRDKALCNYHETECPLMPTLIEMEFTKLELLALRTIIKARNDHSNWSDLFKTIENAEVNEDSEFRGHVQVDGVWVYDSKYYASIHTLASNIEKRSISDIFQKSVSAAVFLWLLEQKTKFLESPVEVEREAIRKYAAGTLLLHIMTSPTNMHGISTNIQTATGDYVEEFNIGGAPYAFHSLLNHSCAPNVVRFSKLGTGRMTLFALRPIKKGMQLFDNYGAHHAIEDRATRHENLRFQYKFTCVCEACVNNWPDYMTMTMRPVKKLPTPIVKRKNKLLTNVVLENLQKGDVATAERLLKPLCELAELLDSYAPCMELADCQETLKQCLQIFHGVVDYGFSDVVDWRANPPKLS